MAEFDLEKELIFLQQFFSDIRQTPFKEDTRANFAQSMHEKYECGQKVFATRGLFAENSFRTPWKDSLN